MSDRSDRALRVKIAKRALRAGVTVTPALGTSLAAYLELLARWNRKINLTALDVDPPSDEAIDRLIVEPLAAARHVLPSDTRCIDIGSGGGSPAIPFRMAAPSLQMVLVEVKVRKSAFLREAVRQLGLSGTEVENRRFEELLARPDLHEAADLVTIRAVRVDQKLLSGVQAFLRPGGRVFLFDTVSSTGHPIMPPLQEGQGETLIPTMGSRLRILSKVR
jgi:16S rRNA (guanine527-N7)-methyltransferase